MKMNNYQAVTDRRLNRMRTVLERRQLDLTIVLENIHDVHNLSAVLRTCDAVGVHRLHLVYTIEEFPRLFEVNPENTTGAHKWLEVIRHNSIESCFTELRGQGFAIYATHLDPHARSLYDHDLTGPVALVLGNENRGVSNEVVEQADGTLFIPMMGMAQSLNISVACAVTLYEALRQRQNAGAYTPGRRPWSDVRAQLQGWLEREGRIVDLSEIDGGEES